MEKYIFDPAKAFETIKEDWLRWNGSVKADGYIIGMSGGVDSSVCAALAARIFGYDRILGVLMPNGEQKDIEDSKEICRHLKIEWCTVNIGKAYEELLDEVVFGALRAYNIKKASDDTVTNMPARLRMTALYAVAQSIGRMVVNTCNLSEDVCGYATFGGDNMGSYAPIQGLTKTEVVALADWLGIPQHLAHKTPVDGLQPKTDEEKLGFTYADLDRYIREDIGSSEFKAKVDDLYRRNKFKTDIVQIPHPNFDYLGNFVRYNNLHIKGDKMNEEIKNELPCKKMTLDEAIDHCESCIDNTPCGQEHKQLAEWLKELQARQKFDEAAHHDALVGDRRPLVEVLRIGRSFQYSDSNYRGATFDTAKLLCDTLELLMSGCSGKMYKALLELRKTIARIGANGKTCSSELCSMMGLIDGALIEKPRNIALFNSGDIKQDINDAIAAFTKETGKSVYNCGEGFNSAGDFVAWLFAKWYIPGLGIDDIEKMKICEK